MHHISRTLAFLRNCLKSKFIHSHFTVGFPWQKKRNGSRLIAGSLVKHPSVGHRLSVCLDCVPLVQVSAALQTVKSMLSCLAYLAMSAFTCSAVTTPTLIT